jgi:ATP-dependent DNA helicase RecG
MNVKDYEVVEDDPADGAGDPSDETLHTGRLVPVYGLTRGLTARPMRRLMKRLVDGYLDGLEDPLPDALRAKHRLVPLPEALRAGHFPKADTDYASARRRLVYDEFLLLQLGLAIRRQRQGRQPGLAMNPPGALARRLLGSLPFALTEAQDRVWREIRQDMAEPYPMNRLLQGDVGSGKTVVAALAILTAVEAGYQAALMAPTEILAEQHLMTLTQLLGPLDVEVALLTNAVKGKARERVLAAAALSTSSIGSACTSGRRSSARARRPTCW